jgi:hypothetical protein
MITFAEAAAERVEEETRLAREAEAEAQALAAEEQAAQPGTPAEAELLPAEQTPPASPSKPTLESLFGPDSGTPQDKSLSAEQVFGDSPSQAPNPDKDEDGQKDKEDQQKQVP